VAGTHPVPGQFFPVQKHHEIGQIGLIVAVATNRAHQIHAHGIAAERKKETMPEAQHPAHAPDEIERQRRDHVAHDLAGQRQRKRRNVQQMALREQHMASRHADRHSKEHDHQNFAQPGRQPLPELE